MSPIIIAVGCVVLFMLVAAGAAVLLIPSKPKPQLSAIAEPLQPMRAEYSIDHRSLRDRELDEDAQAMAGEFKRIRHERYLESLRADAAAYFADSTKKPAAAKS